MEKKGSVVKKGVAESLVEVSTLCAGVYVVRVREGVRSLMKKVMLR